MEDKTKLWNGAPNTDSTGRRPANREGKRQDWGYTDQYRRMMQKRAQEKEKLEDDN